MKFLGVLLAIFAVSCVRANSEECTEERVKACMENFLPYTLSDSTVNEAELCRELGSSSDCLKEAKYDCLGELDLEVDDKFEELKKFLDKCAALYSKYYEDLEEEIKRIQKCYKQNEDYIMECIHEGTQQALTLLTKKDDMDENTMKCERHRLMAVCLVDRIREKCGETPASWEEENSKTWVAEACNAVEGIDDTGIFEGNHLIGDKKRK